jgi:hypothetical protein
MASAETGPAGGGPPPARPSFLSRVANFLNSTAGIAILGFLLTTVAGTFITNRLAENAKDVQNVAAAREKHEQELSDIRNKVELSIVKRELYSEALIEAMQYGAPASEVAEIWPRYQNAYRDNQEAYWRNHLSLEGRFDLSLGVSEPVTTVFWDYLDLVIEPRFDQLHACIEKAHEAFNRSATDRASPGTSAYKALQQCESEPSWDSFKGGNERSISSWDDFQICLENYTYHLDWMVRIQSQVWQQEEESGSLVNAFTGSDADKGCDGTKPACWKKLFLASLQRDIAEDCGNIPPN